MSRQIRPSAVIGGWKTASHLFWVGGAVVHFAGFQTETPSSPHRRRQQWIAGRMSAFRLADSCRCIAEYPLSLPGYYYRNQRAPFALLNASLTLVPITHDQQWNVESTRRRRCVDTSPAPSKPGHSLSGRRRRHPVSFASASTRSSSAYEYVSTPSATTARGEPISFLLPDRPGKGIGHSFYPVHPGSGTAGSTFSTGDRPAAQTFMFGVPSASAGRFG